MINYYLKLYCFHTRYYISMKTVVQVNNWSLLFKFIRKEIQLFITNPIPSILQSSTVLSPPYVRTFIVFSKKAENRFKGSVPFFSVRRNQHPRSLTLCSHTHIHVEAPYESLWSGNTCTGASYTRVRHTNREFGPSNRLNSTARKRWWRCWWWWRRGPSVMVVVVVVVDVSTPLTRGLALEIADCWNVHRSVYRLAG